MNDREACFLKIFIIIFISYYAPSQVTIEWLAIYS